MLIDWIQFGPALLFLLAPIALFHGRKVRYRAIPSGFEQHWSRTFTLGLHTIDLGRAILGAWWLADALDTVPDAPARTYYLLVAIQASVLFVGTLLQTFVCKEEDGAHPPYTYVAGLVIGFLPPPVAAFALFIAVLAALGMRAPAGFFPLLAIAVVGAGTLIKDADMTLYDIGSVAWAVMSPWLFTLLFPRHFVVAYAAKRSTGVSTSPFRE